ncbi:MAG TPA: hypothetical protein VIT92_17335 [Burkholderiaceae bacterium]
MSAPSPFDYRELLPMLAAVLMCGWAIGNAGDYMQTGLEVDLAAALAFGSGTATLALYLHGLTRKRQNRPATPTLQRVQAGLMMVFTLTVAWYAYVYFVRTPDAVVFGSDPLKQLTVQGEAFRRLPEDDRRALTMYVLQAWSEKTPGLSLATFTGRTVRDVLPEARAWRAAHPE